MNKIKIKKGEIEIQTIFYIMMSIFMISIIVFGINKIFFVQDILTEQDRVFFKNQINDALNYCEDPLNKGNFKSIDFENNKYNSVCILSKNYNLDDNTVLKNSPELKNEILTLLNSLDSSQFGVILLKTEQDQNKNLISYQIIDFLKIENFDKSICFFDEKNSGNLELNISC